MEKWGPDPVLLHVRCPQVFLAQLEQQAAMLSQEVSKLRSVEQQEMFLNPTQGVNWKAARSCGSHAYKNHIIVHYVLHSSTECQII